MKDINSLFTSPIVRQLRRYDQWALGHTVDIGGWKGKHLPINPNGTKPMESDYTSWRSLREVQEDFDEEGHSCLFFNLAPSDPFIDICMPDSYDTLSGKMSPLARCIVSYFQSYTFLSETRTDIHVIAKMKEYYQNTAEVFLVGDHLSVITCGFSFPVLCHQIAGTSDRIREVDSTVLTLIGLISDLLLRGENHG